MIEEKKNLVNIAYLGGSHGAFLKYFVDRFSKLTPPITESPFLFNGTSHNLSVNYSGCVNRHAFTDKYGNVINNYKLPPEFQNHPAICIIVDDESLVNFTRLGYFREDDHEFTGTQIYDFKNTVKFSNKFFLLYKDKIQSMYNIDMTKSNVLPKLIVRDFFKFLFINFNHNSHHLATKEIKKNLNKKTLPLLLSDIWNTEKFMKSMAEIDRILNLQLDLGEQAKSLHIEFLNRIPLYKTFNRVDGIINAIQTETNLDCCDLDFVEQGFLHAWIEKNYKFIITPITRDFFKNTEEILEYIKYYPNHYKAMNPNLPTFNNIPNPFYLWNLKK
jgi:hypothetical protein